MLHDILEYTYKTADNLPLRLKVYLPEKWSKDDKRAVVVFYFGGGWEEGSIDQFKPQSEYFASKGMVAVTPEYRVSSRHGVTPFECVEDARVALKWVYDHWAEMGIDPEGILVGGGSAGGHLAACTAILRNPPYNTQEIWKIPKAMILFNPVVDTTENGFGSEKLGKKSIELSPIHHIAPGMPPSIVFHGTDDKTVPFENARDFCSEMVRNGNASTLVSYEGKGHGFFNIKEGNDACFRDTMQKVEEFLRELGYLE